MASSFKILKNKQRCCFHLELTGEFDGSSALAFINVLKKNSKAFKKIIVQTDRLKSVHPFGRDVFLSNLSGLNGIRNQLVFTGKYADQLSPDQTAMPRAV